MKTNIIPENNLSDFILSRCNRKAAKMCFRTALNKAEKGAILFVYGPSPCGKTHLLRTTAAVYSAACNEEPLVVSFQQITDALVASIAKKDTADFYAEYGSRKLLLIDDVQYLLKFSAIRKEFTDVFARLTEHGVNIILFSGYKLNSLKILSADLREKNLLAEVHMKKADITLRKQILSEFTADIKPDISKRLFHYLVTTKNIEISSFKGCVSTVSLVKFLGDETEDYNEIIKILKGYER